MGKKSKNNVVTYLITKQELMADEFPSSFSKARLKKELSKLAAKYNKQDDASQIIQIELLSIEENDNEVTDCGF